MLDYETQRKAIVVFLLAVVLTIIIAIIALIFIWIPKGETVTPEFETGKIHTPSKITEEEVVKSYYTDLMSKIMSVDVDSIYDLISEDYIKYNKLDKEKLINYLIEKGVYSKILDLVQYSKYAVPGYSNVYELNMQVRNSAHSVNIVIMEKSPNNYTIAFDKFIECKENTFSKTVKSIACDVKRVIRYTNSVQYELKFTNMYNGKVTLNKGATAAPLILVNSKEEAQRPIFSTLATSEVVLNKGESKYITVAFNMEDEYQHLYNKTMVLKNVEFEGIVGTSNIEYAI